MTKATSGDESYQIRLTPLALEMLREIKDQREQKVLSERIDKLKHEPEKQGKPLVDNLSGYRSVRAVGQRYRIVYQVLQQEVIVLIVGVGRRKEGDRKDIYAILERLLEGKN